MRPSATGVKTLGNAIENTKDEEGNVAVFTKEQLKKHYDKCVAAKQRMHDANADWKSALDAAEKAGIPKKEFKDMIRDYTKPLSDDYKATRNIMDEMMGRQPSFNFEATQH